MKKNYKNRIMESKKMTMEDLLHVDIDHLNSGFTWLRGPSRGPVGV